MRRALISIALATSLVGCSTRDCKPGTVQVQLAFSGGSEAADALQFSVTVGANAPVQTTINHPAGHSPDTTQLTFSNYPAGQSLVVSVTATSGGTVVGTGQATTTLAKSCTVLSITVAGVNGNGSDMGLANGTACAPGDSCASGNCVDGYCCDSSCTDPCAACDVSGKLGTCSAVSGAVHGSRTACTNFGMSPCGGTCDGTSTQCTYPTVSCGTQSCTSGVAMASGTCSMGTCTITGPTMTNCADKLCGSNDCQTVTQVALGANFACALLSDKTVRCWGANNKGQLGQGGTDTTPRTKPTPVPGLSNVVFIAAGDTHVCAIIKDPTSGNTTVDCWGNNADGELGLGGAVDSAVHATPTAVPGLTGVKQLTGGAYNTCALLDSQQIKCWGDNLNGQVGDGTSGTTRTAPTTVCASGSVSNGNCVIFTGAIGVELGVYFGCAATTNGTVYCWGANDSSQLGIASDGNPHPNPLLVNGAGFGGLVVTKIAVGAYSACALSSDGTAANSRLKCWGNGSGGQLGSGSIPTGNVTATPVTVCTTASCSGSSYLTGVTEVTMGHYNSAYTTCAVASSAVWCWGNNGSGQMGLGTTDATAHTYAVPSLITASSNASDVTTYGFYTCAVIQSGGTLRCFGFNGANALMGTGDTTTMNITTPTSPTW